MNIEKIVNVLNQWAFEVAPFLTVTHGEKFFYDFEKSQITVNFEIGEFEEIFSNYFYDSYMLDFQFEPFVTNFIHELGHGATYDYKMVNLDRREFYLQFEEILTDSQAVEIYGMLDEERAASAWAADYINREFDKINQWLEKIREVA